MPRSIMSPPSLSSAFIKVSATNRTTLLTDFPATLYNINDLAIVYTGEQELLSSILTPWTASKYKYPQGLYIVKNDIDLDPTNNYWTFYQTQSINSLNTLVFDVNDNWTTFYNSNPVIKQGARINYNGVLYQNATGNITATNPTQDALNWDIPDSNVIRYYNDLGIIIEPFRVLHLKSATVVNGKLHPTPDLADASKWELTQGTLAISCEQILPNTFGCAVKDITKLTGGDTSQIPAGSQLWLSADGTGKLTHIKPTFPNYAISCGGNYNQASVPNGQILVSITTDIYDTFNDAWDGSIRETFTFSIVSDGVNVTGGLINRYAPANPVTLIFSNGLYTFDTSATVSLISGTATIPQMNYVFIDKETKTLQVSTSGYPTTEHAKVSTMALLDASSTQTYGALRNQNINDHIKTDADNGHILHMAERIRSLNATWDTGVAPTLTGTPSNLYMAVTSGKVWQMHRQTFPALNMMTGDDVYIVNDTVAPYRTTTNLNTVTTYSDGTTWNNQWTNFVIWGVANQTEEPSHIMCNLSSNGYSSEDDAIHDRENYTNYTIPREFQGVGFLIGRFTVRRSSSTFTYSSSTGFLDLRGFFPNNTAGGGSGSSGVSEFTQLNDTPSAYTDNAGKFVKVNDLETGLEFSDTPEEPYSNGVREVTGNATMGTEEELNVNATTATILVSPFVTGQQKIITKTLATGTVTVILDGVVFDDGINSFTLTELNEQATVRRITDEYWAVTRNMYV